MAKFWESLSEQSRELWPVLYEYFMKREWVSPKKKNKRAIQCETKLESLSEIDKLMRERPNPTKKQ